MRFLKLLLLILLWFLAWGQVLGESLTLEAAINTALENNPALKGSQAEYEALKARRVIFASQQGVKGQLSGTGGSRDMQMITTSAPEVMPSSSVLLPSGGIQSVNFSLMAPLYTGGRLKAQEEKARFNEMAGKMELERLKNEVAFGVKSSYYEALLKEEELKVYRQLVTLEEEQLRISENLLKSGKIPLFYHLRAKTELAKARQELNYKLAEKENALVELKRVLGKNQDFSLELSDPLTPLTFEKSLAECIATAKLNQPDLARLENQLKAGEEEIKMAKSMYSPQIYLMGMYEYKNSTDKGYGVSTVASLPVIDSGYRKARLAEAGKNQEQILYQKKALELNIEKEVAKAWQELKAGQANLPLTESGVIEAQEVYRIARLRYEAGKSIYVETLDALLNQAEAQIRKITAVYQHNLALASLKMNMGWR